MGRYDLYQEKNYNIIIVIGIVVVLLTVLFWFYPESPDSQDARENRPLNIPEPAEKSSQKPLQRLGHLSSTADQEKDDFKDVEIELPQLDASDAPLKAGIISFSPGLEQWLNVDQIIKRYLLIINDFSQGLHPQKHFRFLSQSEPFVVENDPKGIYISKVSYQRYDDLAAAVHAINTPYALRLYRQYRPLLQQVFDEFGYPEEYQLEDIFKKAAANMLEAPIVKQKIRVIRPSVVYKYADKKLEALNPVQKQMLRMGPENTRIIQDKLRLLLEALLEIED